MDLPGREMPNKLRPNPGGPLSTGTTGAMSHSTASTASSTSSTSSTSSASSASSASSRNSRISQLTAPDSLVSCGPSPARVTSATSPATARTSSSANSSVPRGLPVHHNPSPTRAAKTRNHSAANATSLKYSRDTTLDPAAPRTSLQSRATRRSHSIASTARVSQGTTPNPPNPCSHLPGMTSRTRSHSLASTTRSRVSQDIKANPAFTDSDSRSEMLPVPTNHTETRNRHPSRAESRDRQIPPMSTKHPGNVEFLPNDTTTPVRPLAQVNAETSRMHNGSTSLRPGRNQNIIPYQPRGYIYRSLQPDTIRLLIVHPGKCPSELDCSLIHRPIPPLDSRGRPKRDEHVILNPYEALSYSWDGQTPTHAIRIRRDDGGFYHLNVTENLLMALQTLRHPSALRRFWVDAICINQEDSAEKSQQLPLMSRIYSEADNVCVWLGAEDDSSSLAFGLMKKMRILKDFDCIVEKKTTCEEWKAFTTLMKRNWFSRRWVVQEITLARCATIHCGSTKIDWRDFAEAVALFEIMIDRVKEKFRRDLNFGQHPDTFGDVREFNANRLVAVTGNMVDKGDDGRVVQKTWTLEYLVSALTPFQAGQPHDIIYAVLSLAKDVSGSSVSAQIAREPDRNKLPPEIRSHDKVIDLLGRVCRSFQVEKYPVDYKKTFYQVCKDFLEFTTTTSKSLDIICRPWAPVQRKEKSRLPSWIRTLADAPFGRDSEGHWDRKNANNLVGLPGESPYKASGTYRGEWSFNEDLGFPILSVKGFQLDVVDKVEGTARSGVIPSDWLRHGNLEGVQYNPSETETGTSRVTESFWRTMVAGKGPDGQNPPPYYSFVCEKTFTTVVEGGGDVNLGRIHDRSTNTLQKAYIKRVQSVVWGRRLMKTDQHKLLALVPRDTKHGDLICILLGCSVPIVLRKVKSLKDGQFLYKFVGESYVHGMMAGEAFEIRNQTKTLYQTFKIR